MIRENLRRFIAQHTLSEFLANVSPIESIDLTSDSNTTFGDMGATKLGGSQAEDTVLDPAATNNAAIRDN